MSQIVSFDISRFTWDASRLHEAIEFLARKTGYSTKPVELPKPPETLPASTNKEVGKWLENTTNLLSLESVEVSCQYKDLVEMLSGSSPAILRLNDPNQFIIIIKSNSKKVKVIAPNLKNQSIRMKDLTHSLCGDIENKVLGGMSSTLREIKIPESRRESVEQTLLKEQLSNLKIAGCWMLRLNPGDQPWKRIVHAKLPHYLAGMLSANLILSLLGMASWAVIGYGALGGHFEWGWLFAWALIVFTIIPFQLLSNWLSSLLTINMGSLFKERLLYGVLNLSPDDTRHQGIGQFMGRVMESESVKTLAMSGGLNVLFSITQFLIAFSIFISTRSVLLLWLFLGWSLVSLGFVVRYYVLRREFTNTYRGMTNDLIERMVGHRTRIVQESPDTWHEKEDQILARYLDISEKLDRLSMVLYAFIPRGWLLISLACFSYLFVVQPTSQIILAITLGGIMLASKAFNSFIAGINGIVGLLISWEQFKPIFLAGRNTDKDASATPSFISKTDSKTDTTVLIAKDLVYKYKEFGQTVLDRCSLEVSSGDKILLEGRSGGGKSTLGAIFSALRDPLSGLLLFKGVDKSTLGNNEWRKNVVMVPQFHENHILTETFLFNLLMGRNWPATNEDIKEAEIVCKELGLDELLNRMPSGFQQMIGESGWRLSHGEKSRLYIARALLQNSEILVLDESFAALDPENLDKALNCVFNRVKTLILIAHP